MRFAYRLTPTDPTWVEAGPDREAQYLRLAPGSYTLEIRACSQENDCADAEPVRVRVAGRPLAQTAAMLFGAIAIVSAVAAVSRRFRRVRQG